MFYIFREIKANLSFFFKTLYIFNNNLSKLDIFHEIASNYSYRKHVSLAHILTLIIHY